MHNSTVTPSIYVGRLCGCSTEVPRKEILCVEEKKGEKAGNESQGQGEENQGVGETYCTLKLISF